MFQSAVKFISGRQNVASKNIFVLNIYNLGTVSPTEVRRISKWPHEQGLIFFISDAEYAHQCASDAHRCASDAHRCASAKIGAWPALFRIPNNLTVPNHLVNLAASWNYQQANLRAPLGSRYSWQQSHQMKSTTLYFSWSWGCWEATLARASLLPTLFVSSPIWVVASRLARFYICLP